VVLRVVATGKPVIREVSPDSVEALRRDERIRVKELFRYQSRGAKDAVAGPKSQAALNPVNARMPWRFGNLGKKMLSHLSHHFELVVAPRTVNNRQINPVTLVPGSGKCAELIDQVKRISFQVFVEKYQRR
jgi:hypothetical protein